MKIGVRVECARCKRTKKPRGRSQPIGASYCDWNCEGYNEQPLPGTLWPGETEEEFGYPVGPHGWKEIQSSDLSR